MKKIKITSALLSLAMAMPAAYAQETEKKTAFENDFKVTARIQTRVGWFGGFEARDRVDAGDRWNDVVLNESATTGEQGSYTNFKARRIRLGVKGKINKKWEYVVDLKGENLISFGSGGIQEATFGYILGKPLRVRLGSMKIPFTREQMTSSGRLLTMERSMVTNELGHQFDVGLQLDGVVLNKMITYGVGVFNGNGGFANGSNGVGTMDNGGNSNSPMGAARIQIDPLGQYKNGKSMFSSDTLVSLGLGAYFQGIADDASGNPFADGAFDTIISGVDDGTTPNQQADTSTDNSSREARELFVWTADLAINIAGANIQGGYVHAQSKNINFDIFGWYANVAYFLMPKTLQVWARYEVLTANYGNVGNLSLNNKTFDMDTNSFASIGLNLYPVDKHKVKIQAAYYMGMNKAYDQKGTVDTSDDEISTMGTQDDWFAIQAQISI